MSLELAHFSAVVPATVAACCVAGTPHRRVANSIPAALMVLSMLDMATGCRMLPAVVWAALLLLAAVIPAILVRLHGGPTGYRVMALHRSIGLVVMAALTLVGSVGMGSGIRAVENTSTGSAGHEMAGMTAAPGPSGVADLIAASLSLPSLVVLAALVFAALTGALLVLRRKRTGPGHRRTQLETLGMGLSIAVMALSAGL
ncbi:hypothetical protein KPL76_09300 [Subtercola sp. PAMC28395]|uniref:hypothetical protein n=1 Tax=Subtercola sp. PAMC28395 TaxID=2846775 RepID=UPI001C0CEBC6|nr:hypothetical protein [Subtercola sp. PAMC28395]QWT22975.1 hypothetical protein KPL76_09300 [Subtercola sp. PAMC28395]